jgi:hypothetical protein
MWFIRGDFVSCIALYLVSIGQSIGILLFKLDRVVNILYFNSIGYLHLRFDMHVTFMLKLMCHLESLCR